MYRKLIAVLALCLAVATYSVAGNNPIFSDSFETGDTSNWSATYTKPIQNKLPCPNPDGSMCLTWSAYGALSRGGLNDTEFVNQTIRDYQQMTTLGFMAEEVWLNCFCTHPTYHVVDANGNINRRMLDRLKALAIIGMQEGVVVSIRLDCYVPPTHKLNQIWKTVAEELNEFPNIWIDVCNEAILERVSAKTLGEMVRQVRRSSPDTPVTISSSPEVLGSVQIWWERNKDNNMPELVVDYIAHHGPRGPPPPIWSPGGELQFTLDMVAAGMGIIPYYGHEPHRRGYEQFGHEWPPADEILFAGRSASIGGAVAWCFHNGEKDGYPGSFSMENGGGFVDTLDSEELDVILNLRWVVDSVR